MVIATHTAAHIVHNGLKIYPKEYSYFYIFISSCQQDMYEIFVLRKPWKLKKHFKTKAGIVEKNTTRLEDIQPVVVHFKPFLIGCKKNNFKEHGFDMDLIWIWCGFSYYTDLFSFPQILLKTSESKKPEQITVLYHYCNLSRFFESDVNSNAMLPAIKKDTIFGTARCKGKILLGVVKKLLWTKSCWQRPVMFGKKKSMFMTPCRW